jgi:hypothetical protein
MVSQTMIKALNSVQAQLIKIPGLSDEQVEQIQAIITKNTQPKIKGTGKKSGYILFSVTERKRLKDSGDLDGLAFGDVAKLLGKNWREASQEVRDKWNSQAKHINDGNVQVQPIVPVEHVEVDHSETDPETDHENPKPKAKPKSKGGGKRGRKPKKSRSDDSESD